MHPALVKLLRKARSAHIRAFRVVEGEEPGLEPDQVGQAAGDLIRERLESDAPCMVCRFGRTELRAILRYVDVSDDRPAVSKAVRYVRGDAGPFWWDDEVRSTLCELSGFFPSTDENLARFGAQMLEDSRLIDVIATWLPGEARLAPLFPDAKVIPLGDLEPYRHAHPWSHALEGRRVVVVHPFADSIRAQYAKRALLFRDPRVLPDFELHTVQAVQSIAGNPVEHESWFAALDSMCEQIRRIDFDVALIGAGAYGMPLAAFVKRLGKKAVHLGGASQLLFGIRGKRWDDRPDFQHLFNEHWIRPAAAEAPANRDRVEAACYW
jgi:hypothetical protein